MKPWHHRTVIKWLESIPPGTVFKSEGIGRGNMSLDKIQVSCILKQHPELVEQIESNPKNVRKWRRL